MHRRALVVWIAAVVAFGLIVPALAVIELLTPLKDLIEQSDSILVAKVDKFDATRPAMVLSVQKVLKGKPSFQRLPVSLQGRKPEDSREIVDRLEAELPLVLFVTELGSKQIGLAYTSGTWFGLIGQKVGGELRWSLTNPEKYLRRTFKGKTAELEQTISAALAGTRQPPAPNSKEPPGLGPPIQRGK